MGTALAISILIETSTWRFLTAQWLVAVLSFYAFSLIGLEIVVGYISFGCHLGPSNLQYQPKIFDPKLLGANTKRLWPLLSVDR